jgi:hypothetical protein
MQLAMAQKMLINLPLCCFFDIVGQIPVEDSNIEEFWD